MLCLPCKTTISLTDRNNGVILVVSPWCMIILRDTHSTKLSMSSNLLSHSILESSPPISIPDHDLGHLYNKITKAAARSQAERIVTVLEHRRSTARRRATKKQGSREEATKKASGPRRRRVLARDRVASIGRQSHVCRARGGAAGGTVANRRASPCSQHWQHRRELAGLSPSSTPSFPQLRSSSSPFCSRPLRAPDLCLKRLKNTHDFGTRHVQLQRLVQPRGRGRRNPGHAVLRGRFCV